MPAKQSRHSTRLDIAGGLLAQPTAALKEDLPAKYILDFAATRPALGVKRDAVGNIILAYPKNSLKAASPQVWVAHLDHPGFWIEKAAGKSVQLSFQGWVRKPFAHAGLKVAFFERDNATPTGRGVLTAVTYKKGVLTKANAKIKTGCATPGGFAMWDFPGFELRSGKIFSRGCDDLLGAGAALAALDELCRTKAKVSRPVWVLFTRAEEIGFQGALWAARKKTLPMGALVLSLECSRALPSAPQSAGVIVRIGDFSGIFDPSLCEALRQAALSVQRRDKRFKFQRKLMDGGTCEASAFTSEGWRAAGLALPLGNYHNQAGLDGGKQTIGPEYVAREDFEAEVDLLVELAKADLEDTGGAFKKRLDKIFPKAVKGLRSITLLY